MGCGGNALANETGFVSQTAAPQQTKPATANVESAQELEDSQASAERSGMHASAGKLNQEKTMDSQILVAYFSATGTTEQAAEILDADIYEIIPEEPYTEADLAYYTGGRADQEQETPDARPGIANSVEDMGKYDTVLLGYPIWHGQAPRIISTFLESYDFSGKTIIPFCTSHSSSVGSSAENLHSLCQDTVIWAEGMRFAGGASSADIESWLQTVLPEIR